jgi:predicted acetyltransferase
VTEYRFESFAPVLAEGAPDVATRNYMQAVLAGFHDKRPKEEDLVRRVERAIADDRRFTAAYVDHAPEHALDAAIPVATFAHFEKRINVGGGRLVPAHLITWVTVRPTHRRRGLLRSLMTANLTEAKAAGYPFAALTATEGGIYSRFGFGAATWYSDMEIDTTPGFALVVEPDRRVEICEASKLAELAPAIYQRFVEYSPGAMERQALYTVVAAGELDPETGEEDRGVRAALHYDLDGEPDGYVSYKFSGKTFTEGRIEILDFVAVSDAAYSALWAFLGAVDLVKRISFDYAAQESPLPWLLTDPRRAKVLSRHDGVWLRILDVVKALEARPWTVPGTLTIKVNDPMHLAEGTFRIMSDGTGAEVETASASVPVDLELGVAELGSIYLGGADPVILTRAGRITAHSPGAAMRARSMFGLERAPYSPNDF